LLDKAFRPKFLSRFQKRGLIDAQGKLIRIIDIEGLRHL